MMLTKSLVLRYYAYRITNAAGFYLPISILYLQHKGFSLAFIGLTGAIWSLGFVVGEVPTGYIGDRVGRRTSLIISKVLVAFSMGAYAFADSALVFAALFALWATGITFRSGTEQAWLYELLKAELDESEFARIESRGSAGKLIVSAASAIAGGILYSIDVTLPFLVNAGLMVAGIPILLSFPAIATDPTEEEVFTIREAVQMLHLQARRPAVRWFVVYLALFAGLWEVTWNFSQPALNAVDVSATGIGVLYAAFKLVSAGAASTVSTVEARLGQGRFFGLLAPLVGLVYASIIITPMMVVPVLFFFRGIQQVIRPMRNQYLNDRLEDVGRATVLSGVSMVTGASSAAVVVVAGWIANLIGPVAILYRVGITVGCSAVGLWIAVSPVRSSSPQTIRANNVSEATE